jgi:hypothetical protein
MVTEPASPSFGKQEWPLIISIVSLIVSILSFAHSYISARNTTALQLATATQQLVDLFTVDSRDLGNSTECFNFANQLERERFYDLLGIHSIAFDFTAPAEDHLMRCMQSTTRIKHLSAEDALKIRKILFGKLNSFQRIYRSASLGQGYPATLCGEVRTGFESGPKEFVQRILSMTPRPAQAQSIEREFGFVVDVAQGRLCQGT